MRDFRTYFVDAHSGAIVHVENEVDEQGAVGSGFGIQNDLKKVGSSHKCMHDSGMISPITRRPKDEE